MDKKSVRVPQQKRSIEKKEKIIEAAFRSFMKNGYFGTNTADIAKEAGISTGSVYAYFQDKKDILLECLYRFGDTLTQEICNNVSSLSITGDINVTIKNVLRIFVNVQNYSKLLRDEILSLKYIDSDIKNYFLYIQDKMMESLTNQLEASGYTFRHKREQTFLLFQMIMGIENELAFEHTPDINKEILIDECTQTIIPMLVKKEI